MNIEKILNENFNEILNEVKSKAFRITKNGKEVGFDLKNKKNQEKYGFIPIKKSKSKNIILNPDDRVELSASSKKHKYPEYRDDGYKKFKPGRERLITSVIERCEKRGISLSSSSARDYIYEFYNRWLAGKESWLDKYEAKAKAAGFDVRKYIEQKRGASAGVWRKEWKGRANFFVPFMNAVANHFVPRSKWWGEWETLKKSSDYDEWRKNPYKWWGNDKESKAGKFIKDSNKNKTKKAKELRSKKSSIKTED